MRIGPWQISRVQPQPLDQLGRPLHPWEMVTLDQLSPDARRLIQKMARVCARDFFEEQREAWLEILRQELDEKIRQSERRARARQSAPPGRVMDGTADHTAVLAQTRLGKSAMTVQASTPHVDSHLCAGDHWRDYCRESCTRCMHPNPPVPCPNITGEPS